MDPSSFPDTRRHCLTIRFTLVGKRRAKPRLRTFDTRWLLRGVCEIAERRTATPTRGKTGRSKCLLHQFTQNSSLHKKPRRNPTGMAPNPHLPPPQNRASVPATTPTPPAKLSQSESKATAAFSASLSVSRPTYLINFRTDRSLLCTGRACHQWMQEITGCCRCCFLPAGFAFGLTGTTASLRTQKIPRRVRRLAFPHGACFTPQPLISDSTVRDDSVNHLAPQHSSH